MEILDVYDKYKTLTGKKILKNQYRKENNVKTTTYTCIINVSFT